MSKKIIISILVIAMMIIGVAGCMRKDEKLSVEDIIKTCSEKYGDTFILASLGNELWNADYSEIIIRSEKLDCNVTVWIYEDGTVVDNYVALKYKGAVEELVKPYVETVYGECIIVNTPIHYGQEHFDAALSLEEYVSTINSRVSITIATNRSEETGEEDAESLLEMFKQNGIFSNINVFYYQTDIGEITASSDLSNVFNQGAHKRLAVLVNQDYSVYSFNWSK